MNRNDLRALYHLISIHGIGPGKIRSLIGACGTPSAVVNAPLRKLCTVPGIDKASAGRIKSAQAPADTDDQLDLINSLNIHIVTFWDKTYPPQLKTIYDPPIMLFVRGDPEVLRRPALAVIGTRNPTRYGKQITEKLTRILVQRGFVIVSGFARGIDSIAHYTAAKWQGATVAVLGCGLDTVYPAENRQLSNLVLEKGAIISEYPLGTAPDAGNFPRRNRIVSGLSQGILVVEAGTKSGALITAFQALEQNREVFAVPGPITSSLSHGTNRLIQDGAKLVMEPDDIMQELPLSGRWSSGPDEPLIETMGPREQALYELLSGEPVHVDQLALKLSGSPAETLSLLLRLELKGLVRQMGGKMFLRA